MKLNEISARQLWVSLIVVTTIPSFRLLGPMVVRNAGNAAPVSALLTFVCCVPLFAAYAYIANRQPGKTFAQINTRLFGKTGGGLFNAVYTVWVIFLAAFYLGQYGERINGTLFYDTNMVVFLLILLFAVSYGVKRGAATLARTGTVLGYMILAALFAFCIILLRDIKVENYLPLSRKDALPSLAGILPGLAVTVFFPIFFVYGNSTTKRVSFLPYGWRSLAVIAVTSVAIIALPLGVFGKEIAGKLTMPFFAVSRNMVVFDSLERLEAIVAAVLIMSDFVIVSLLAMTSVRMVGEIFDTKKESMIIDILIFGIFTGGLLTSVGEFQTENLVRRLILPVDIALGILIPLLWFFAAKIRNLPKSEPSAKST